MSHKPAVLDDYLELVTYGFTNPMPDANEGPWKITAKDVMNGEINFGTARKTTQEAYDKNLTNKSRPKIGDVLLTKDGTLGRLAIVKQEGLCISQSVAVLRTNQNLLPEYLFYLLTTPKYQRQMIGDSDGTVIKHIYITRVGKMEVNIPSVAEQKLRLNYLVVLDEKIRINHQINQTLEQMAQAIFKSWFVDFEPVKAKIAALEAGGNEDDALLAAMQAIAGSALFATDAVDAQTQLARLQTEHPEQYTTLRATAELFPSSMQESELGEIPEGWIIDDLDSQIDVLNGFAFKSQDYIEDQGIFVFRTKNFSSFGIAERLSDDVFLPLSFTKSHKRYLCEAYDYHLVMVGASVGKTAIIFPSGLPALRNQNMWCFRPTENSIVGKAFTKYMLDTLIIEKKGLASGSAREFFRKGDFQKQKICFATIKIQEKFHEAVFSLLKLQSKNHSENLTLANLRDTLLPKLLSGEPSLAAAEEQLADRVEPAHV